MIWIKNNLNKNNFDFCQISMYKYVYKRKLGGLVFKIF